MANNESITDIIAEKRREAQHIRDINDTPRGRREALDLEEEADRLEAALKREREELEAKIADLQTRVQLWSGRSAELVKKCDEYYAHANRCATTEKSSVVGNAAKLREALIKARSEICKFAKYQCDSLKWENSNLQANCGDILCSWRGLCEAKTAINAALAATERKGESDGNE